MKSLTMLALAASLVSGAILSPLEGSFVKGFRTTTSIKAPNTPAPAPTQIVFARQEGHNAQGATTTTKTTTIEPFAEGAHAKRQDDSEGHNATGATSSSVAMQVVQLTIHAGDGKKKRAEPTPTILSSVLIEPFAEAALSGPTSTTSSVRFNPTVAYDISDHGPSPGHPNICEDECDTYYIKCMDNSLGRGEDLKDCKAACVHDTCVGGFTGCWACGYFDETCAAWKIPTSTV